jgi:hypothetical protein
MDILADYFIDLGIERPSTETVMRSKYCYEQIVPVGTSTAERADWMLEDLNRYFRINKGFEAQIVFKTVPCYLLVRTSEQDKIGVKKVIDYGIKMQDGLNDSLLQYNGGMELFFKYVLPMISHRSLNKNFLTDVNEPSLIILNLTGWERFKLVSINLPHFESVHSIADLREALKVYDLDIIQAEKPLPFFVFRNSHY